MTCGRNVRFVSFSVENGVADHLCRADNVGEGCCAATRVWLVVSQSRPSAAFHDGRISWVNEPPCQPARRAGGGVA